MLNKNRNTIKRKDVVDISGSSFQPVCQFMEEIRDIPYLDSKNNKIAVNDIDGMIRNYDNNKFLIVEDKCYNAEPTYSQMENLKCLHNAMHGAKNYVGLFLLQHENSSSYSGYNKISVWKNNQWQTLKSGSVNPTEKLTGDNVFSFISKVLK